MIFGIIWELVLRKIASSSSQQSFPRFNSRVFFYLFLPSTVLESAALLSNKWLYLNLLPILIHSIFGTLFYAASLGFTIYSLTRQNILNLDRQTGALFHNQEAHVYNMTQTLNGSIPSALELSDAQDRSLYRETVEWPVVELTPTGYDKSYVTVDSPMELDNLTLADCLVFGTILSSVDSTTMLGMFRLFQINDKVYYLTLGESLMNNAVVLVIFNLLLDFFNETKLTVVKIYIAIIQFFITLIGSVFVGLLIAVVALIAVRLTKRFRVPCALTSYQNQCHAMVETLLILKLAYLTYTIAGLAGASSIVSLATFGILQDQYIKPNLNLRSQLTYRQVVLATKTMGFSLVYPLLGMLLVEVADAGQFFQTWNSLDTPLASSNSNESIAPNAINTQGGAVSATMLTSMNASKLSHLASRANLQWNFKFLSLVTLITVVYRFIWVVLLSLFCNLFSSSQLKIKFKEQILVAYGGLKGPLAFALVHRLVEHEEYKDRTMRNKHLFVYTILFITFISTILKGSFIRPLVGKMQHSLCHNQLPAASETQISLRVGQPQQEQQGNGRSGTSHHGSIVFKEINGKLTEYMAHGLNSILGYRKSPYDRFVELNETTIKPWLTRDGSNTNWLSVFYDSLILDETLNDFCFYRSSATVLQSYWHMSTRHRRPSNQRWRAANGLLDTIDEHADHPHRRGGITGSGKLTPTKSLVGETQPSTVHRRATSRNQLISRRGGNMDKRDSVEVDKNSVLKEYVMFNLKLEDARRRKQTSLTRNQWSGKVEPAVSRQDSEASSWLEQHHNQSVRPKVVGGRMLSTTSSDERDRESSGANHLTRRDKRHHLIEIERQLMAIDSDRHIEELDREAEAVAETKHGKFRARQPAHQRQVVKARKGKTRAQEQYEQHRQPQQVEQRGRVLIERGAKVGPVNKICLE